MNHGQHLRDLLEPLGVYRWEGSFQWGELQSEVQRWTVWPMRWPAYSRK